jgi:hypothetical protein
MDMPQPQPEGIPAPEATEEKVNVYELTSENSESVPQTGEKLNPTETKNSSSPVSAPPNISNVSGQSLPEEDEKTKKDNKEPVTTFEEKTPPASVWVERVEKVIKLFKREPFNEQQKAQELEEQYLEEKEVKLKDNDEQ